jgi:hypothetical protein
MTYTAKDPREQLVETGNQLLECLYKKHLWALQYPHLVKLVEENREGDDPEVLKMMKSPEFIPALIEAMTGSNDYTRLYNQYTMLRDTIEALDKPRPGSPLEGPDFL